MAEFTATVFQNEFLPDGGTDVHAIVTVDCSGAGTAGQIPDAEPERQVGLTPHREVHRLEIAVHVGHNPKQHVVGSVRATSLPAERPAASYRATASGAVEAGTSRSALSQMKSLLL